jgi:Na+/melibiose symporter-like transporter
MRALGLVLLLPFMGAGLIGAPFFGRLARRIGKHRTVQLACVAYALSQILLVTLPNMPQHYGALDALPIVLAVGIVGFVSSCFTPMLRAMAADVVDEVKLYQGADMTSLIFSMVTTTTKIGASLAVAVVFPLLSLVHYDGAEGAANTPATSSTRGDMAKSSVPLPSRNLTRHRRGSSRYRKS